MGVLAADFYAGPVSRFDLGNALVVDLYSGNLESVTDITLLGGANALAVETGAGQWEIVQAGAAKLIAPSHHRLTRLLRGQRGTEGAIIGLVPTGARVVVLNTDLASLPISEADLGLPWNWRIGPALKPVSDETFVASTFTPEGAGLRPFSVAHVEQPWRTARSPGDLTIRWTRRSRSLAADTWSTGDVPLAEEAESDAAPNFYPAYVETEIATSHMRPSAFFDGSWFHENPSRLTRQFRGFRSANTASRGCPCQAQIRSLAGRWLIGSSVLAPCGASIGVRPAGSRLSRPDSAPNKAPLRWRRLRKSQMSGSSSVSRSR